MEFLNIPQKLHMLYNNEWQGRSAFVICSKVHTGLNTEGRGRQKKDNMISSFQAEVHVMGFVNVKGVSLAYIFTHYTLI